MERRQQTDRNWTRQNQKEKEHQKTTKEMKRKQHVNNALEKNK